MELTKFQGEKILPIIRHNMRALPSGKYGNTAIVPELSSQNEELVSRGKTPEEVNAYRKDLEKEIFKYNRKNLVHMVNVVIQCPYDCPPEEEERFFKLCHEFWVNRLPMGERCIIQSVIHRDEIVKSPAGKRISHNHLHLSFIPAVPDTEHEGYAYKLCADQLTKKSVLRNLHPELQAQINAAGLHATVYRKYKTEGKTLKLSVADLKKITEMTGGYFTGTVTVEDLADLINTSIRQNDTIKQLETEIALKNRDINNLVMAGTEEKLQLETEIAELKNKLENISEALSAAEKEKEQLKKEMEMQSPKVTRRTFSWDSKPTKTAEKEQEVIL